MARFWPTFWLAFILALFTISLANKMQPNYRHDEAQRDNAPESITMEQSPWISGPGNHKYQFHIGKQSWLAAREKCLAQNADLVTIGSQEEMQWLLAHYKPQFRHLRERQVQIGLLLEAPEGDGAQAREWRWVNGNPLDVSAIKWTHGEPFDHAKGKERCALLNVNERRVDDIDCDLGAGAEFNYRFVCQRSHAEHIEHESLNNPLWKKLEDILTFFGISSPEASGPETVKNTTSKNGLDEEGYWDKVFNGSIGGTNATAAEELKNGQKVNGKEEAARRLPTEGQKGQLKIEEKLEKPVILKAEELDSQKPGGKKTSAIKAEDKASNEAAKKEHELKLQIIPNAEESKENVRKTPEKTEEKSSVKLEGKWEGDKAASKEDKSDKASEVDKAVLKEKSPPAEDKATSKEDKTQKEDNPISKENKVSKEDKTASNEIKAALKEDKVDRTPNDEKPASRDTANDDKASKENKASKEDIATKEVKATKEDKAAKSSEDKPGPAIIQKSTESIEDKSSSSKETSIVEKPKETRQIIGHDPDVPSRAESAGVIFSKKAANDLVAASTDNNETEKVPTAGGIGANGEAAKKEEKVYVEKDKVKEDNVREDKANDDKAKEDKPIQELAKDKDVPKENIEDRSITKSNEDKAKEEKSQEKSIEKSKEELAKDKADLKEDKDKKVPAKVAVSEEKPKEEVNSKKQEEKAVSKESIENKKNAKEEASVENSKVKDEKPKEKDNTENKKAKEDLVVEKPKVEVKSERKEARDEKAKRKGYEILVAEQKTPTNEKKPASETKQKAAQILVKDAHLDGRHGSNEGLEIVTEKKVQTAAAASSANADDPTMILLASAEEKSAEKVPATTSSTAGIVGNDCNRANSAACIQAHQQAAQAPPAAAAEIASNATFVRNETTASILLHPSISNGAEIASNEAKKEVASILLHPSAPIVLHAVGAEAPKKEEKKEEKKEIKKEETVGNENKADKIDKLDKVDKADKADDAEKSDKSDKTDKADKTDKSDKKIVKEQTAPAISQISKPTKPDPLSVVAETLERSLSSKEEDENAIREEPEQKEKPEKQPSKGEEPIKLGRGERVKWETNRTDGGEGKEQEADGKRKQTAAPVQNRIKHLERIINAVQQMMGLGGGVFGDEEGNEGGGNEKRKEEEEGRIERKETHDEGKKKTEDEGKRKTEDEAIKEKEEKKEGKKVKEEKEEKEESKETSQKEEKNLGKDKMANVEKPKEEHRKEGEEAAEVKKPKLEEKPTRKDEEAKKPNEVADRKADRKAEETVLVAAPKKKEKQQIAEAEAEEKSSEDNRNSASHPSTKSPEVKPKGKKSSSDGGDIQMVHESMMAMEGDFEEAERERKAHPGINSGDLVKNIIMGSDEEEEDLEDDEEEDDARDGRRRKGKEELGGMLGHSQQMKSRMEKYGRKSEHLGGGRRRDGKAEEVPKDEQEKKDKEEKEDEEKSKSWKSVATEGDGQNIGNNKKAKIDAHGQKPTAEELTPPHGQHILDQLSHPRDQHKAIRDGDEIPPSAEKEADGGGKGNGNLESNAADDWVLQLNNNNKNNAGDGLNEEGNAAKSGGEAEKKPASDQSSSSPASSTPLSVFPLPDFALIQRGGGIPNEAEQHLLEEKKRVDRVYDMFNAKESVYDLIRRIQQAEATRRPPPQLAVTQSQQATVASREIGEGIHQENRDNEEEESTANDDNDVEIYKRYISGGIVMERPAPLVHW